MNGSPNTRGDQPSPELWVFLGGSPLCWRVPPSVGVALPRVSSCVFHPSRVTAGDTWTLMCWPSCAACSEP